MGPQGVAALRSSKPAFCGELRGDQGDPPNAPAVHITDGAPTRPQTKWGWLRRTDSRCNEGLPGAHCSFGEALIFFTLEGGDRRPQVQTLVCLPPPQ